MSDRQLLASIDGSVVGTLGEDRNLWAFQYASQWLADPSAFALSPHLPLQAGPQADGATERAVQWYFDNLLPEEGVRALLARDAGLRDIHDAFALLEYYGRESAGSLTLRRPDDTPPADEAMRRLTDAELDARIRDLPAVPLTHDAPKKMSLAGAQHKLAVVLRDGELYEPGGQAVSTHILKPEHPQAGSYPCSVINEWFIMRLAGRVGLDVPEVERRYVPAPVYLIQRFDREMRNGVARRLHAIDGCQLLNLAPTMKYSAWSLGSLLGLANACRARAVARLRIYRWLLFCILVGNGDSHLKNLSFLLDRDGISLAPHYDLLCESVYETRAYSPRERWPDLVEFTSPIAGVQRYAAFTRTLLLEAGQSLGLAPATAARQLDDMLRQIPVQADGLIAETIAENEQLSVARPELRATLAGEMQLLRAIRHVVIGETVSRLGA